MIQYFPIVTGSLTVLGNINVSGSITTSGSITISGSITSASFASTASFVALAQSASFVANAQTASFVANAQTASYVLNAVSSSFASTASFVALAQSASNAVSAATASFANNLTVAGTLTAQTLVVQTITSSVIYSSGSNVFGNDIANTQVLTGSVTVTGSLAVVTNGTEFQVTSTGVKMGNVIGDAHSITGSVGISGSATFTNRINGVVGGTLYNTAGLWLQGSSTTDGIAIGGTGGGDKTIDTYGGTLKINATSGNGLVVTGSATFSSTITATGIIKSLAYVNVYDGSNDIYLRSNADFGLGALPAIQVASNSPLQFATNNSIKMIITSGGDVLVGWTGGTFNDPSYNGVQGISLRGTSTGTSIISSSTSTSMYLNRFGGGAVLACNYSPSVSTAGTTVGTISVSSTATSYNTTSDYRLKEDLKDFNGLEKVSSIKVYDFKWKNSEERMNGVIAHELQVILPYAVLGEKDAEDMQGVDYSKLVPSLVKAIQELNTKFEEYKATHP